MDEISAKALTERYYNSIRELIAAEVSESKARMAKVAGEVLHARQAVIDALVNEPVRTCYRVWNEEGYECSECSHDLTEDWMKGCPNCVSRIVEADQ